MSLYLSERSASQTAVVIEAIYDTVVDPAAWPLALKSLRELIDGAGGVLFLHAPPSDGQQFWVTENLPSIDAADLHDINRNNPHLEPTLSGPPGVPHWDHLVLDDAQMDRHEFYANMARFSGTRYFVGMRPLSCDGKSLMTSIRRTKKQGHFSEQEIALYAKVAPHIGHAFRLAATNAQARGDAALYHLLDRRGTEAVFLLDAAGRLMEANGEASRILALDDGLRVADGSLVPWKAADGRGLNDLIAGALATAAGEDPDGGGLRALPRPSGALPFLVRVAPWPNGRADSVRRPSAVVLVRDPERAHVGRSREIGRILGLTERETAVACRLAQGAGLQVCATELGISYGTARVHLRNIYEKTGVSSQRDLVRLVLAVP